MTITTSVSFCILAYFALLWLLRRDRVSLGLPVAYLFGLLLIHVPGAISQLSDAPFFDDDSIVATGIQLTAIGSWSFFGGAWLAIFLTPHYRVIYHKAPRVLCLPSFWRFCLSGGLIFSFILSPFLKIPTVGALIDRGGGVWMLGVLLALRYAVRHRHRQLLTQWFSLMFVFPVLYLVFFGFMAAGASTVINSLSGTIIVTRSYLRTAIVIVLVTFFGLSLFATYFIYRDDIRRAVWGGATLEKRIDVIVDSLGDFQLIDLANKEHVDALGERLNQNYFVGLAVQRIDQGRVDYLNGRSISEGLMALVPRAIWPDKPVFGGSPKIVAEMTGLTLNENTSFGVGAVLEFYVNFGYYSLVGGFVLLGWAITWLDRKAALAEKPGDLGRLFLFFLPAIALIQPNGSVVELVGGVGAAWVAGLGWRYLWFRWQRYRTMHEGRSYRMQRSR